MFFYVVASRLSSFGAAADGLYNQEYFEKHCRDVQQRNDAIIAIIDQAVARIKESSVRDIFRKGTAFAVDWYLTGKALGTLGKFFKFAKVKGIEYAERIKQAIPRPVAITPEGIPVSSSIAEHASQMVHNYMEGAGEARTGRVSIKVYNMSEFFSEFEFGKILKQNSTKLNQTYKHAQIFRINSRVGEYLKKGYHFYIDTLHYDHLEVFDKFGKIKYVLNFDGSLNKAKTAVAIMEKRTIKL